MPRQEQQMGTVATPGWRALVGRRAADDFHEMDTFIDDIEDEHPVPSGVFEAQVACSIWVGICPFGWWFRVEALAKTVAAIAPCDDWQLRHLVRQVALASFSKGVTQLRTQDRPLSLKLGRRVLHRHRLSAERRAAWLGASSSAGHPA